MDIDVFAATELPTVFRVLRTALRVDGPLDARERLFLDTFCRIVGAPQRAHDPAPLDARDVVICGAHSRKRLLQLAALAVLLSRPVRPDSLDFLKALAMHLETKDSVVDVIDALAAGRLLKVRLMAMRRVMRVMLREAWLAQGAMGIVRVLAAMVLKAPVNRDTLWRYRRLGLLPEGTLGREYWKFMTREGFSFPGDIAGIPDTIAYHDVSHVLAGHPATPLGEIQQGSFQGGNRREDGFFFIQMVILQFHQGVRVTPATGPQIDFFQPDKVLWAIHRGACCSVDMTHQWNYWPLMHLPLEEARHRCGLLPKLDEREVTA